MTPGMKMMMLDKSRRERTEMGYRPEMNYRPEMTSEPMSRQYRRYSDGRFAPRSGGTEIEIENRFRDRRGREHYNNGRYAPMRSAYDGSPVGGYDEGQMTDHMPPIYDTGTGYRYDGGGNRMIGFAGGQEMQSNYRMDATHKNRDEMEHRYSTKKPGFSESDIQPMTKEKAQQWVRKMKNSDGTTGEHWSFDQTSQVMKQRNIDCDPVEFYAAMNMLWSDYGKVAERFGVSNVDYWAEISKAFLMDKDAMEDKLALYYECIVKK